MDGFYKGYAVVLANVWRECQSSELIENVMQGDGVTLEQLEGEGADEYDLSAIAEALGVNKTLGNITVH